MSEQSEVAVLQMEVENLKEQVALIMRRSTEIATRQDAMSENTDTIIDLIENLNRVCFPNQPIALPVRKSRPKLTLITNNSGMPPDDQPTD